MNKWRNVLTIKIIIIIQKKEQKMAMNKFKQNMILSGTILTFSGIALNYVDIGFNLIASNKEANRTDISQNLKSEWQTYHNNQVNRLSDIKSLIPYSALGKENQANNKYAYKLSLRE